MSLVVDANMFFEIFVNGSQYPKLKEWVFDNAKGGVLIWGGTRLRSEVLHRDKAYPFLNRLKRIGKLVAIKNEVIDSEECRLCKEYSRLFKDCNNNNDDNDPHIVALCILSEAKLIATKDKGCQSAVKQIYPKNRPKFYTEDEKHSDLLTRNNTKYSIKPEHLSNNDDL